MHRTVTSLGQKLAQYFSSSPSRPASPSGHFVENVGLTVPADFAVTPYQAINSRMAPKSLTYPHSWKQFVIAWNAVPHRYRACAEHDAAFAQAVLDAGTPGVDPQTIEAWYVQQRELFAFFVLGLSVVESLCYGLYAVGAVLNQQQFPITKPSHLRAITINTTADKFAAEYPNTPLTSALQNITSSQEFKEWKEVRHALIHRGIPARVVALNFGIGMSVPPHGGTTWGQDLWTKGVDISRTTTADRKKWLAMTMCELLEAADSFTTGRL